jgi:integrase
VIKFKKVGISIGSLGMKTYDLLDPETGQSVPFYADYLQKIISEQVANRKQSQNTIDAISNDLKVFLEYVCNAQKIFFDRKLDTTATLLSDIILSYPDYLAFGSNAQKPIARETALATSHTPIQKESANRYLSTVNGFVGASAIIHERLKEALELNLIDIDIPSENIHASLLQRRELNHSERNRLQQQSVLSQVVSGGGKYTKTRLFRASALPKGGKGSDYKYFPISHIEALLNAAPTYRDRALWALLLGGGLRMSEAAQLLVTDVDIVNETVKVFTYRDRVECFEGVKLEDVSKLSFKGRETEEVYFIYPFNEIFFESITKYLKHERPKGLDHKYLFVTNSNRSRGRPLFATTRSNRGYALKKAQEAIGCPLKNDNGRRYTLHSLRHFYGYWLVNFHRTPAGQKFSIKEVQDYMGHALLSSTQRYAVIDKVIQREKMRLANLVLQNRSAIKDENLLLGHARQVLLDLTSGI